MGYAMLETQPATVLLAAGVLMGLVAGGRQPDVLADYSLSAVATRAPDAPELWQSQRRHCTEDRRPTRRSQN
jgi:hypothetical protein